MDVITIAMINAAVLGTPILIGISWWNWLRRDRALRSRRVQSLRIGLAAASANALMYYGWCAYATVASNSDTIWQLNNTLGNYIAVPLVLLAMIGAIAGKGAARLPLALSAVMGLFLWINIGIL
jgi:hypothetical protein